MGTVQVDSDKRITIRGEWSVVAKKTKTIIPLFLQDPVVTLLGWRFESDDPPEKEDKLIFGGKKREKNECGGVGF